MTAADEILAMLSSSSKLSESYVYRTLSEHYDPAEVHAGLKRLIEERRVIQFELDRVSFLRLPDRQLKGYRRPTRS